MLFSSVRRHRRLAPGALSAVMAGSCVLAVTTGVGPGAAPANAVPLPGALTGKTVFLDPGHQGSAAGHDLRKQVSDGRGGKKDCQTTGATAITGKTEHAINWEVAQLVKAGLESQGAKVVLSRADDTGWGGCVDERAAAASRSGAALAVSIHADSTGTSADSSKSGFHLIVPKLPVSDATVSKVQGGEGLKAAGVMRDALQGAGLHTANYGGVKNGLMTRSDVAGPNLTRVPLVFIEMGNLSNPDEAKTLSSAQGEMKYATAITDGISKYVSGTGNANPQVDPTAPVESLPPATGEAPKTTVDPSDFTGLADVGPLIESLTKAKSIDDAKRILLTQGSDVSSDVLRAMLSVVYAIFGGKLPI